MPRRKQITNGMPSTVVRRLTGYLALVQDLCLRGEEWVSSMELAEHFGLTSSTVRQDLSHIDFSGISKKGYEVAKLCDVLRRVLGADKEWKSVVVGAGNLGTAIANHGDLERRGFLICGLFDIDEKRIGKQEGRLKVSHIRDMEHVVKENGVEIGIIAVPAKAAQQAADSLVKAGVSGILNLSVSHISVPSDVRVISARMVSSLLELTHAVMSR